MKRTLAILCILSLLLLCACAQTTPTPSDDPIFLEFESQTWQLHCVGSKGSVNAQAAEYFAQQVYRETNGAVTMEVTLVNSLSAEEGDISMASSLLWSQVDPRFGVLTLPFLFSSEADASAALDGAGGTALAEILSDYHQHCIGIGSEGFRRPTGNAPITSPADFTGLRLCVDDHAILQDAYRLWGAECVSLSWPLVYTALRTGTYDGQEMPLEDAYRSSIQDVQSHVTDWTALYSGTFFCMQEDTYASLSPTLREIVDDCGEKTIARQRTLLAESDQNILAKWRKAKVTVTALTPEAAAEFRSAAQPCYDNFAKTVDAELLNIFTG